MTDAGWNYPGLGFDPLPGDPELARSLQEDARTFGQRMTDEAKRLRRFAHRDGWQGEAADAFAEHLDTLPRDLQRCGDAFSNLALALGNYHHAFTLAKTKAADLERRAVEARTKLQAAQAAFDTPAPPVIQAPDAPPVVPDHSTLDTTEDELGAILREAHQFAEHFDDSPEVQQIAAAIRSFTEFAPDEPRWNIIRRWAGDVFAHTPVGVALNAAHELINHFAEFFSDLADFLSDLSSVCGLLTLPLIFVPPIGSAVAVAALATAAGSAALKTSLYVGHARDANGNLYVSGGELIRSVGDVAINAAGIGTAAGTAKAVKAVEGTTTTFGRELAGQFERRVFREAARAPGEIVELGREMGARATARLLARDTVQGFARMSGAGKAWTVGGVALTTGGPLLTATESGNLAGWHAIHHFAPDLRNVVIDAPNEPDLQLRVPPTIAPATAPSPVMDR